MRQRVFWGGSVCGVQWYAYSTHGVVLGWVLLERLWGVQALLHANSLWGIIHLRCDHVLRVLHTTGLLFSLSQHCCHRRHVGGFHYLVTTYIEC